VGKLPGAQCEHCPLRSTLNVCVPPTVPSVEPKLLMIGESPGQTEAVLGRPFVGPTGKLIRAAVRACKVNDEELLWTNAVACWPHQALPWDQYNIAMQCCRPRLDAEIEKYWAVPRIAMGRMAQDALYITMQYQWQQPLVERYAAILEDYRLTPEPEDLELLAIRRSQIQEAQAALELHQGDPYCLAIPHPAAILRTKPDDVLKEGSHFLHGVHKACSGVKEWPEVNQPEVITSVSQLPAPDAEIFTGQDFLVVDLETGQVDWMWDLILLVGIGVPAVVGCDARVCGTISWVVPTELVYTDEFREWLLKFVEVNGERLGGHNMKFDTLFMWYQLKVPPKFGWDTILASHVYDENWARNLKELVTFFFDAPDYESANKRWLKTKTQNFGAIPRAELVSYLAKDLHYNLMLAFQFRDLLTATGQYERFYKRVSIPVAHELTRMEYRGVVVDMDFLSESKALLRKEADALTGQIAEETGGVITKPGSTQQCSQFVYDILKAPKCTIAGLTPRSTAKAALDAIKDMHPAVATLRAYRRTTKMLSSYILNLESMARYDEGTDTYRVHPRWLQFSVVTGRLSARDPAIQTIPHVDDSEEAGYGKMIRDCLVVPPDWMMVAVDGSQWELRVVACMSGDELLMQAYREGRDFHTAVTERMFGKTWTKQNRYDVKRFVFSYMYGGSEQSSAQVFQVPRHVVRELVGRFNTDFKRLVEYRKESLEIAKRQHYLESRLGRRFHFPLMLSQNADAVRKGSINYPTQGAASDVTMLALASCGDELRSIGVYPVITVHDSIIMEAPPGLEWQAAHIAAKALEDTGRSIYPEIPWKAEAEMGVRWGSLKEVSLREVENA